MKELYYCRHGITEDLENGLRNRPDTPLTSIGRQEARQTGLTLIARNILPQLIVCSQLRRAVQSAQEIAGIIGTNPGDIIPNQLLDERYCGEAIGMKNMLIKQKYPEGFDSVPGAETTEALQDRAALAARWLESLPQDRILVVGHSVAGRALARHYQKRPYTEEFDRVIRKRISLQNGQIMRLCPSSIEMFT